MNIRIMTVYKADSSKDCQISDYDKEHPDKPHWILLKKIDKRPRFLSISTKKNIELIYKAFGDFYYPINTLPSQEVQRTLINAVSEKYDEIVGDLNVDIGNFIFEKVKKLNLSKKASIVDLGAGTGLTSTPFVIGGYKNIVMLDASDAMRNVALRKSYLKNIKYKVQDARKMSFNKKFDLAISSMFLCDLDLQGINVTIRRLVRYLNRGAYIVFVEDEDRDVYNRTFKIIEKGYHKFNDYSKFYIVGRK